MPAVVPTRWFYTERLKKLSCSLKQKVPFFFIVVMSNKKEWDGRTLSAGERPEAARLLRSWVRIPPGAWIFVCCECRVLSGRGLCDELITCPEESYRLCCVVVCNLETSRIGAPYIYDISCLRLMI